MVVPRKCLFFCLHYVQIYYVQSNKQNQTKKKKGGIYTLFSKGSLVIRLFQFVAN